MTPAVRVAVSEAGRRADDNVPATSGYGDKWADEFIAGLHDAGYALIPLAPEVSPRRDDVARVELVQEALGGAGVLADGINSWSAARAVIDHLDALAYAGKPFTSVARLAATRTPEPPDSGDGAARSRSVIRRENVQAGRPMNEGIEPTLLHQQDTDRAAR